MTTKNKKLKLMLVSALKKDLNTLRIKKQATEDYIKVGCGHFLNIGNDQWCGGKNEVNRFLNNMISLGEKWLKTIESLKPNSDYLYRNDGEIRFQLPSSWAFESDSLVFGSKQNGYPDCFPNLNKIVTKLDKSINSVLYQ